MIKERDNSPQVPFSGQKLEQAKSSEKKSSYEKEVIIESQGKTEKYIIRYNKESKTVVGITDPHGENILKKNYKNKRIKYQIFKTKTFKSLSEEMEITGQLAEKKAEGQDENYLLSYSDFFLKTKIQNIDDSYLYKTLSKFQSNNKEKQLLQAILDSVDKSKRRSESESIRQFYQKLKPRNKPLTKTEEILVYHAEQLFNEIKNATNDEQVAKVIRDSKLDFLLHERYIDIPITFSKKFSSEENRKETYLEAIIKIIQDSLINELQSTVAYASSRTHVTATKGTVFQVTGEEILKRIYKNKDNLKEDIIKLFFLMRGSATGTINNLEGDIGEKAMLQGFEHYFHGNKDENQKVTGRQTGADYGFTEKEAKQIKADVTYTGVLDTREEIKEYISVKNYSKSSFTVFSTGKLLNLLQNTSVNYITSYKNMISKQNQPSTLQKKISNYLYLILGLNGLVGHFEYYLEKNKTENPIETEYLIRGLIPPVNLFISVYNNTIFLLNTKQFLQVFFNAITKGSSEDLSSYKQLLQVVVDPLKILSLEKPTAGNEFDTANVTVHLNGEKMAEKKTPDTFVSIFSNNHS